MAITSPPRIGFGRLWQIVEEFPTHSLELLGGISALARGTWLLVFTDHVHDAPVSAFVEALLPTDVWAIALILFGIGQCYGLAVERDHPYRSLVVRWISSLGLVALSAMMLAGYIVYEIDSIAIPLYFTMTLKQLWIFMRSRAPALRNGSAVRRRDDVLTGPHGSL
jgi:hypothetical protein